MTPPVGSSASGRPLPSLPKLKKNTPFNGESTSDNDEGKQANQSALNSKDHSKLLASIEKGTKLRKVTTNDRSGVNLINVVSQKSSKPKESMRGSTGHSNEKASLTYRDEAAGKNQLSSEKSSKESSSVMKSVGGLFAGGFPKLKKAPIPNRSAESNPSPKCSAESRNEFQKHFSDDKKPKGIFPVTKNPKEERSIREQTPPPRPMLKPIDKTAQNQKTPIYKFENEIVPSQPKILYNGSKTYASGRKSGIRVFEGQDKFINYQNASLEAEKIAKLQADLDAAAIAIKEHISAAIKNEDFERCVELKNFSTRITEFKVVSPLNITKVESILKEGKKLKVC